MSTSSVARLGEYRVPDDAAMVRCHSCNAQIVWTHTSGRKAIPLSVSTIETRDGVRYALTHFADCTHSREWRGHGAKATPDDAQPHTITDGEWTYTRNQFDDWRGTNEWTGERTMLKGSYAAAKQDVDAGRFVCACWPDCEHKAPV